MVTLGDRWQPGGTTEKIIRSRILETYNIPTCCVATNGWKTQSRLTGFPVKGS